MSRGRAAQPGMVSVVWCAAAACAALAPRAARAQQSGAVTSTASQRARALFREAVGAVERGAWAAACAAFEQAYALEPLPEVLFNLAGAQAQTGQLVRGLASYDRFLAAADLGPARSYREAAVEARRALEARTPRVRLALAALGPRDTVRVDGAPLARAALAQPLRLDPGAHVLTVSRGGAEVARAAIELAEGEAHTLALAVPPPTSTVARDVVETARAPVTARRAAPGTPWGWVVLGVVVGVAGVAAGVGVGVSEALARQPTQGNVGDGPLQVR